jgi:hypothetical protein
MRKIKIKLMNRDFIIKPGNNGKRVAGKMVFQLVSMLNGILMETPKLSLLTSMVVLKVLLQNGSRMVRLKKKLFITLAS